MQGMGVDDSMAAQRPYLDGPPCSARRCSTVARANAHDQEPWEFFSAREDPSIPGPSNTPAHEEDTELLYPPRHGLWRFTDTPGLDLQTLCRSSDIQQVYVILFGVGSRDTEGIYSLRAYNEVTGLPQETIIVFESEEDASRSVFSHAHRDRPPGEPGLAAVPSHAHRRRKHEDTPGPQRNLADSHAQPCALPVCPRRYAGLLEATMDHVPAVCSIPPQELLEFCRESGYLCRVEPCGSLLIPPDYNVRITDWERSMRLRYADRARRSRDVEQWGWCSSCSFGSEAGHRSELPCFCTSMSRAAPQHTRHDTSQRPW